MRSGALCAAQVAFPFRAGLPEEHCLASVCCRSGWLLAELNSRFKRGALAGAIQPKGPHWHILSFTAGQDPVSSHQGKAMPRAGKVFLFVFDSGCVLMFSRIFSANVLFSHPSLFPASFSLQTLLTSVPCTEKVPCASADNWFSVNTITCYSKAGDRAGNGQSLASGSLLSGPVNGSSLVHLVSVTICLVPYVPSPAALVIGSYFTGAEHLVLGCW